MPCINLKLLIGLLVIGVLFWNSTYYFLNIKKITLQNNFFKNSTVISNKDIPPIFWHKVEPIETPSSYVLASFYDLRVKKIVVFLASEIGDSVHDIKKVPYVYICHLHYSNETVDVEGYFYTGFILHCPLPNNNNRIPTYMSVKRKQNSSISGSNWRIPVTDLLTRNMSEMKGNVAMCVGLLFGGYQNWLMLLQYIEFHRMQGVDKFIIFYSDLHSSAKEILDWYDSRYDFIETIEWLPPRFDWDDQYLGQLLRNNFCTYSLMYKYKYVGHSDMDELFFPVGKRLDVILNEMNEPTRGSFTFAAKYHQILEPNCPEWNETSEENILYTILEHIPLYQFNNVSSLAPYSYSPKVILKPETVLVFVVHYVYVFSSNETINYDTLINIGFLRHFKVRKWWGGWADDADKYVNYTIVDPWREIGLSVLSDLINNITKIVHDIKKFV